MVYDLRMRAPVNLKPFCFAMLLTEGALDTYCNYPGTFDCPSNTLPNSACLLLLWKEEKLLYCPQMSMTMETIRAQEQSAGQIQRVCLNGGL